MSRFHGEATGSRFSVAVWWEIGDEGLGGGFDAFECDGAWRNE